ncbi:MAG: hypothetical protein Tsb005_15300 [Gammaproteobacteria bacterium]
MKKKFQQIHCISNGSKPIHNMVRRSNDKFSFLLGIAISLLLISQASYAQGVTDWQQLLVNLSNNFPAIERLVTGLAYVIGVILVIRALYYLKVYGELRTMMAAQSSLKAPMTYLVVGAVFIFLPTAKGILFQTVFDDSSTAALSYIPQTTSTTFGLGLIAVLRFVQLIGIIAFIRGWMIVASVAGHGGRASLGKGIVHIVAGIFAMNIAATYNIIRLSLGL